MNSTDEMASRFTMNVDEGEQYVRANLGEKVKRTLGKLSFVREAVAACRFIMPHVNDLHWGRAVTYLDVGEPLANLQTPD